MSTDELRELQEWRRRFCNERGEPMTPAAARAAFDRLADACAAAEECIASVLKRSDAYIESVPAGADAVIDLLKQLRGANKGGAA